MKVEIGKRVLTSTGKHVGNVDHIVLDRETKQFLLFIVWQVGLLSRRRMVEPALVERVDADGTIRLNIDEDRFDQLFEFMPGRAAPTKEDNDRLSALDEDLTIELTAPTRLGPVAVAYERHPAALDDYLKGGSDDTTGSILPPNAVVLDHDSKVVDRDGNRIGSVEAVIYTTGGSLVSIEVRGGHLEHRSYTIPESDVASMSRTRVVLRVSKDEMERG